MLLTDYAQKGISALYLVILETTLASGITLALYSHPLLAFQHPTTAQPHPRTIKSERDLFFAIDTLNYDKPDEVSKFIVNYRQHVTPKLWQWLSAQASFHAKSSGYDLTLRRYKTLLAIARVLEDNRLIGISHYAIGRHLSLSGKYHEAIESYKLGCILLEGAQRHIEWLQVLSSLSQIYFMIGDTESAQKHAEKILDVIKSRPDGLKPSGAWSEGYVTATAWSVLASIDYRNGQHPRAIQKYLEALDLYQRSETLLPLYGTDICNTLNNLGEIYSLLGDHRQAFKYLIQSLELAKDRTLPHKEIETLLNLGSLYLKQDNYTRSAEYFRQSEQRSLDNHSERNLAKSLLGLGIVAFRQSQLEQSSTYFQQCLKLAIKVKDADTIILVRQHLGAVLHEQGRYTDALKEFNLSEILARKNGDVISIAELLWRKAEVQISLQNYKLARELAEESRHLAEQLGLSKLLQLSATTIAQLYLRAGLPSQSIQLLTKASEQLEKMRGDVIGGIQSQQIFFEKRIGVYHALIDLLIDRPNVIETLNYAERAKGRLLYEQLGNKQQRAHQHLAPDERLKETSLNKEIARLNRLVYQERLRMPLNQHRLSQLNYKLSMVREEYSQFRDILASRYNSSLAYLKSPPSISEAISTQTQMASKRLFLEYVVTDTQMLLFSLTRGPNQIEPDLRVYPLKIKRNELAPRVHRIHQMMAQRHPAYNSEARSLYDLLLKPVEAQLQEATSLCIIPDDALWDVPFQVLQPKDGRFLLEDMPIYYAPSLSILSELVRRRESPDTFKPTSYLAFGNPVTRIETINHLHQIQNGFKFDPLPEAESEVKTIGELFAPERRSVYIGAQASEARFKAEAPNYGIIHFATHGMIDNLNPLYSYLLLASEENDGEDGLLEAREVLDLNLRADTVVLSACETARGRIGAGEGVIGMTWAFFSAGARTAVVSQWKVDSGATAELMTDFYRRFHAGADKPEAMRQAALALLKGPRYSHPFYWASFIVIGSDR